jgi:hypothetical protein
VFIGLAVLGVLLGFIGVIMLVVAAHRALVKIDALPVRVQPASADPRFVPDRHQSHFPQGPVARALALGVAKPLLSRFAGGRIVPCRPTRPEN